MGDVPSDDMDEIRRSHPATVREPWTEVAMGLGLLTLIVAPFALLAWLIF